MIYILVLYLYSIFYLLNLTLFSNKKDGNYMITNNPGLTASLFPIGNQYYCQFCGRNINRCIPLDSIDLVDLVSTGETQQTIICGCGQTYYLIISSSEPLIMDGPIDKDIIQEKRSEYVNKRRN